MTARRRVALRATRLVLALTALTSCQSAIVDPTNSRRVVSGPPLRVDQIVEEERDRIDDLEGLLNRQIGYCARESRELAELAVLRTLELKRDYGIRLQHWVHDIAVNAGLAPRGLCCDWTRDLMDAIEARSWRDFHFVWAVAKYQSILEHSTVVALTPSNSFVNGIVLDGWRAEGELYFSRVADDTYEWIVHPEWEPGARIDCDH